MRYLLSPIACLFLLLLTACEKEAAPPRELNRAEAELLARELVSADWLYARAYVEVDQAARREERLNGFTGPEPDRVEERSNCPAITFTATPQKFWPATLTLDYGPSPCTGPNGYTAAGKVVAVYDGLLGRPGTSIRVTYTDYQHNGYTLNGTYLVRNEGPDEQQRPTFTGQIIDGRLQAPNGKTWQHQAVHVSKIISGQETNFFTHGFPGILDDVWSWSTTASGVGANGYAYTITTDQALRKPTICQWPVSGRLGLSVPDFDFNAQLNYGSGACDNDALLDWNGFEIAIEL